jgi:hypothetical protein
LVPFFGCLLPDPDDLPADGNIRISYRFHMNAKIRSHEPYMTIFSRLCTGGNAIPRMRFRSTKPNRQIAANVRAGLCGLASSTPLPMDTETPAAAGFPHREGGTWQAR